MNCDPPCVAGAVNQGLASKRPPDKFAKLMVGTSLTHYRITAKLGEGGMGEVYRATDAKLGRDVAIKVLPAIISRDAQGLARFERKAKPLATLNHPARRAPACAG